MTSADFYAVSAGLENVGQTLCRANVVAWGWEVIMAFG